MTTWFGARKAFVCKKRVVRKHLCFLDRAIAHSVKAMNEYMRRRGLKHSFIEKLQLQHFVASIHGKTDNKMRDCVVKPEGCVWFAVDDIDVHYRPLPSYQKSIKG
jgi:hypothetical protein